MEHPSNNPMPYQSHDILREIWCNRSFRNCPVRDHSQGVVSKPRNENFVPRPVHHDQLQFKLRGVDLGVGPMAEQVSVLAHSALPKANNILYLFPEIVNTGASHLLGILLAVNLKVETPRHPHDVYQQQTTTDTWNITSSWSLTVMVVLLLTMFNVTLRWKVELKFCMITCTYLLDELKSLGMSFRKHAMYVFFPQKIYVCLRQLNVTPVALPYRISGEL